MEQGVAGRFAAPVGEELLMDDLVRWRWTCVHCLREHGTWVPPSCEDCGSGELGCVSTSEGKGYLGFSNVGAKRFVQNTKPVSRGPRYVKVPLLWRLGVYLKR